MVNRKFTELIIRVPGQEYPVYIGEHLLLNSELLVRHVKSEQVLIVTNDTVAPYYLEFLQQAYQNKQCDVVVLNDGEMHKNQESLFAIYDALIHKRHHRDTTLVALGGGVVGDITGFAAATFQRGVAFIQIPTTLLAQVDASIGGKTAINHPQGKNMIGSFHQPQAVIMDTHALTTLPKREFAAGLAEVIKYGLLAGDIFFQQLRVELTDTLIHEQEKLVELMTHCCEIKARLVELDERETGARALLNLGHTFAHALEACTHYQRWLHGEAVAIGLYCAALLSHQKGYLNASTLAELDKLLAQINLPRRIPHDIDLKEVYELMFNDKKIIKHTLRFVLIRAVGDCYLDESVTKDQVQQVLLMAQDDA